MTLDAVSIRAAYRCTNGIAAGVRLHRTPVFREKDMEATLTRAAINLRPKFYKTVSAVVRRARTQVCRAVNTAMVETYWNVGRLIYEEEQQGSARAQYAAYLITNLAVRLTKEFGRGYGEANLRNFRQFYLSFPEVDGAPIRYTLCSELTWSHYRALMRVPDPAPRHWYMKEAAAQGWTVRTLLRQITSFAYERTLRTDKAAKSGKMNRKRSKQMDVEPREFIKDPYVLEFLEAADRVDVHESGLEQAIIDRLREFMLELGKGFAFVGRQFRVSTETKHFFIDLVFYNYILKCFVLVDLKTGDLTHQDIGQMDMYVRVFEDKVKGADDNPTVGLILCAEKDRSLVKYSVLNESRQLFASKYRPYLPSEAELRAELDRERDIVLDETECSATAEAPGRELMITTRK
jgi:predicted nuclease of restriction endonuclease-like (RecB) superfamily